MPPLDPTQVVTNPQTLAADDAARMEDYWTEARLQSARPMPLPRVYMSRRLREELARRDALAGDSGPIITEPLGPDSPEAVPTAAGFSTQRVNDLTTYPYSVVGKLFMRIGNENYVGSAWVVGERTVFTAGHCVHERQQGWATHVMFRAQYDNGAQAGSFVLPRLATLRGWTQDEDFEFDMALGVSTTPIRPLTGKAGTIANGSFQGLIQSIGYPAEVIPGYNFDGQRMWQSRGDYLGISEGVMGMHNNMTGGCSGGPGVVERNGKWYGMWVNSFRYTIEPNILRSPYFGQGFLNLMQWMRDNGGDA